jgi:carbon storage regulator
MVIMLVLSRKVGEKLVIGDNITVVVSRVAGNRVTLGIEAPDHVRIVRGELQPQFTVEIPTERAGGGNGSIADPGSISVPQLAK